MSGYSYFIDQDALQYAISNAISGDSDCVMVDEVIPAKHFGVLTSRGAKALQSLDVFSVPPHLLLRYLQKYGADISICTITDIETLGEQFLWQLFFAGQRATIPPDILNGFFEETEESDWFKRDSYKRLLCNLLEIDEWSWVDDFVKQLNIDGGTMQLAAQFHWFERMSHVLPESCDCFLEIGFGKFPASAVLMSMAYGRGVALEPSMPIRISHEKLAELFTELAKRIPNVMPSKFKQLTNGFNLSTTNLTVSNKFLEDVHLSDSSIDFCFSKVVFEHVMDVEGMSRELYRILSPGATMVHEIDFRDHIGGGIICFNFLKYSKEQWRKFNPHTNLWRVNDFIELWKDMGFDVEVISREDTNLVPSELHESWKSYSKRDLFCHTATIKAVKM